MRGGARRRWWWWGSRSPTQSWVTLEQKSSFPWVALPCSVTRWVTYCQNKSVFRRLDAALQVALNSTAGCSAPPNPPGLQAARGGNASGAGSCLRPLPPHFSPFLPLCSCCLCPHACFKDGNTHRPIFNCPVTPTFLVAKDKHLSISWTQRQIDRHSADWT